MCQETTSNNTHTNTTTMSNNGTATNTEATVLVTGGCGYIGTHTIVLLLQHGYNVVVVDNLVNSSAVSLDRVAEIVGLTAEERSARLIFEQVDVCDETALRRVFEKNPSTPFHSCIHFAGLKVRKKCIYTRCY
jgi:UDP-glucose 4-epimerase